jgi:hypothetical protein
VRMEPFALVVAGEGAQELEAGVGEIGGHALFAFGSKWRSQRPQDSPFPHSSLVFVHKAGPFTDQSRAPSVTIRRPLCVGEGTQKQRPWTPISRD